MSFRLDSSSPVPLYHQIAETLRYRISTGQLKPGDALLPLRTAATHWGVNLHTVRKAYAALADIGMVRVRRPAGAVVIGEGRAPGRTPGTPVRLRRFVQDVLADGRKRYGLSALQLARLLTSEPRSGGVRRVAVLECSETQCCDLAAQLERRWDIVADPWCLSRPDDLPDGEVIATYFHYNDVRQRWPRRLAQVHFVAIRPDETLPARVAARRRGDRPRELLVCERDPIMLSMILSDLSNLFGSDRYTLTPQLLKQPCLPPARRESRLRLVSPRVWGTLSADQRADSRVMEIRYVFDPVQIERLADELNWPDRIKDEEKTA